MLLKNDRSVLPLRWAGRILVVGKGADSLPIQAGGWSLTWQGDKTETSDYPNAETLLCGVTQGPWRKRGRLQRRMVRTSTSGNTAPSSWSRPKNPMRRAPATSHSLPRCATRAAIRRSQALDRVSGKGVPVVTLLYSGRPVERTISSTARTRPSQPGSPARRARASPTCCWPPQGRPPYEFTGRLSFDWPAGDCLPKSGGIQFHRGYGLSVISRSRLGVFLNCAPSWPVQPKPLIGDAMKKILIVGGGTAGWMTAALFGKLFRGLYDIELVESEAIGTVGVGEATIRPSRNTMSSSSSTKSNSCSEPRRRSSSASSSSMGQEGHKYVHGFGVIGQDWEWLRCHQYWLSANQRGRARDFDKFDQHRRGFGEQVHARAARDGGIADRANRLAFQFDASLYAKYLRSLAEMHGVKRTEGQSSMSQTAENGDIASVRSRVAGRSKRISSSTVRAFAAC